MLIGLAGKKRVGKDTAARVVSCNSCARVLSRFARQLRDTLTSTRRSASCAADRHAALCAAGS